MNLQYSIEMEDFEAGVKISKEWPYDTLFKLYHLYRNNWMF